MANKDSETTVVEFPLPRRGVNLYINPVELHPEEAVKTQNCYYRNGLVKKPGSTQFETDEVQADKKISGLHRFYYSTSNKQLLASSGTAVVYHDGATWQDVQTGLADGNQVHFATWGALQKAYFGNGADELYSWDGSSAATLSGGNIPSSIIQVLPYQDRLLAIDATNPGTLSWSDAFSTTAGDWVAASDTGVKPDSNLFGMVNHSINNSDSGYESAVLLGGSNGMYLFSGTDLRTPATTGNYTIYPLATNIGCNAPRTMVWTPKGTMYLGIDKQVYLLPFKTSTPIPVGQKITSLIYLAGVDGIEDTPSGQIATACAVYHGGFYKLSITPEGGSTNTRQWWADIDRSSIDENGLAGPWYGPMEGETISCFATQTGNGDSGQLMAGDGSGATGKSLVYQVGQRGVTSTDGTAIEVVYRTPFNQIGNSGYRKSIHNIELEWKEVVGTISIGFTDIDGSLGSGETFGSITSLLVWNSSFNWDGSETWQSSLPIRSQVNVSPAVLPRRLSITLTHSTADDTFELYGMRAEVKEENLLFATSNS
jgi:hypothetical protein